jgi:quercetin dioxygenase-like cupin family protein
MKSPVLESSGVESPILESPGVESQAAPKSPRDASSEAEFLRPAEAAGDANQSRLAAGLRFVLGAFREQTILREAAHQTETPTPAREVNFIDDEGPPPDRLKSPVETAIQPRQVTTIRSLGELRQGREMTVLLESAEVRIIQLVVQAGRDVPIYEAAGVMTLQGLDGHAVVCVRNRWHELRPRQLLYLTANEPFLIHGIDDSSLLLTIVAAKHGPNVELIG